MRGQCRRYGIAQVREILADPARALDNARRWRETLDDPFLFECSRKVYNLSVVRPSGMRMY